MTYSSRPVLNATRARQGRRGRHMLWVLLVSTLLAALGLFAAWTWKAPDFTAANSNNGAPTNIAPQNAPEPSVVVPQDGSKPGAPTN
jgi:hypothetical protein